MHDFKLVSEKNAFIKMAPSRAINNTYNSPFLKTPLPHEGEG